MVKASTSRAFRFKGSTLCRFFCFRKIRASYSYIYNFNFSPCFPFKTFNRSYSSYIKKEEFFNFNEITREFNLIQDKISTPHLVKFNNWLSSHLKKDIHPPSIEKFLSSLDKLSLEPNVVTYNILLQAYATHGDAEAATKCFKTMQQTKVKPDVVSFNILLNLLQQQNNSKDALELFTLMQELSIVPTLITFNCIMKMCEYTNDQHKALHFFTMMKKEYKIQPDLYSYNILISVLAKSSFTKALYIYESMKQEKIIMPDIVTYSTLFRHCKEVKECLYLKAEMEKSNLVITDRVVRGVVASLCKLEALDEAEKIILTMSEKYGISPQTSGCGEIFFRFCVTNRDAGRASRVLTAITNKKRS